jgi:hypothetical protein
MSLTIEQLKKDLSVFIQRRDQALHSYHQVLGAISVMEQLLHQLLNPEPEPEETNDAATMDSVPEEQAAA